MSDSRVPTTYRCPECGSYDVVWDATAVWDPIDQVFDICDVMDKGHACAACGEQITPEEVSISPGQQTLDEMVHSIKSAEASELNNQGPAAQVKWLLAQGVEVTELLDDDEGDSE